MKVVFTAPSYGEIDLEGRRHMRDPDGQPTDNFEAQKRRIEMLKIFATNRDLEPLYNSVRSFEKQAEEEERKITEAELRLRDAKARHATAEATRLDDAIKTSRETADDLRVAALNEVEAASPGTQSDWKQKIEPLKKRK